MKLGPAVLAVFGIPWLGHGRRTEFILVLGTMIYVLANAYNPDRVMQSRIIASLFWEGYGNFLIFPLLCQSVIAGCGLWGNIKGLPWSRGLRFAGATLGLMIWTWFVIKYLHTGILSWGFVWCAIAAYTSVGVMVLSAANLPRPGHPGVV